MKAIADVLEKMDAEMKRIASSLLESQTRWDLVRFFHSNPFVIHTANGLANMVGRQPKLVQAEVEALVREGVLRRLPQDEDIPPIYSYEPRPKVHLVIELIDSACGSRPDLVEELRARLMDRDRS